MVCDSNLGSCGELTVKMFFGAGLYSSGLSTYLSGGLGIYFIVVIWL